MTFLQILGIPRPQRYAKRCGRVLLIGIAIKALFLTRRF